MYFYAMNIDDEIKAKFKSPQLKASINVRYTSNFFATIQNAYMSEFGLSMAQFNILRILRGAGDSIAVNTVKERMIEKSPNTTRLMDKLIVKELISRERCSEDRRVVYVKITKNGLKLLAEIDVKHDELDANLIGTQLTDDEANTLSDLLDKMRNSVRG